MPTAYVHRIERLIEGCCKRLEKLGASPAVIAEARRDYSDILKLAAEPFLGHPVFQDDDVPAPPTPSVPREVRH